MQLSLSVVISLHSSFKTMTKILIDPQLRERLANMSQPLQFCDEAGRTVGWFVPTFGPFFEGKEPQISRDEIERRKQSKDKSFSTAEVLAHLESI